MTDFPLVRLGGTVLSIEDDGTIKTLRKVFTDAVLPDAVVPDEGKLQAALKVAIELTKDDPFDGITLEPWPGVTS